MTLKKVNGTFGMVIRGGNHDEADKCRPFTIMHISPGGPAHADGNLRVGDRLRAVNGVALRELKLAEMQSLIYRQDGDTVFTSEYDVAMHAGLAERGGAILVEIVRDSQSEGIGIGLNRCPDSGYVFVESVRQASLADRCGAIHVGDLLLAVNGRLLHGLSPEDASLLVSDAVSHTLGLELLPGRFSPGRSQRSSMPSPSFSSLRTSKIGTPATLARSTASKSR